MKTRAKRLKTWQENCRDLPKQLSRVNTDSKELTSPPPQREEGEGGRGREGERAEQETKKES